MAGRESRTGLDGARVALAVVVLAGIAVTAMLLRPSSGAMSQGRGPMGGGGATVGVAALWVVAALLVNGRYRERFNRYDERRGVAEQRLADVVRHLLLLSPVAVPVLLLGLHRFDTTSGGRKPYPSVLPTRSDDTTPTPLPTDHKPHDDKGSLHLPGWLLHAGLALVAVVVAAAVAYAVWYLLRVLRRPEPAAPHGDFAVLDDEEELLAQAVDSGRRALRDTDDARAAVIACYAAMETSLAASGVARRASDSPQDLLERAAADDLLSGPAAGALTELFREARYSTHPMDDGDRRRASDALGEIAAQLERRAAADTADGPAPTAEAGR
ncbi:protein of unknown function [Actinacidiphila yanglinensis]|uniref:Protein-glutamine gamma-glutamyltransferase-like C-terminal domain-containing protein n=1 Tax=Actinacidiphila yanglinensis TaxID=310779 RepID=A0A1H6CB32_9ACTN|nr:protein of unknown function [Actinacidiphila yanglinensis]